jgi:membrane-bound lytic murein transglycosylase D
MAAYNSGEGKIISCLKGIENPFEERTFWHIRPCLARETQEYPPKIIAAAIVGNNPETFGFPKFEELELDPADESVMLHQVPSPRVVAPIAAGTMDRDSNGKSSKTIRSVRKPIEYLVKKGNKIESIAEVFGVSGNEIRKWNSLRDNRLFVGQKLKIYPGKRLEMITYMVRRGDTISEISEGFSVRPSHLVACNGLSNGLQVKAGKALVLYREMTKKPIIHVVKKGTNLAFISGKYNVRVKDIVMWNNLTSTTVLAGQKLKIYSRDIGNA